MKFLSITSKAVAIALLTFVSGVASAAGVNTLTVNASVIGKCTFNTATSTLNFGAIDPSLPGPVNATQANLVYKCTKNTSAISITPATATRTLTGTGTTPTTLAYTLTISSTTGVTGLGFASGTTTDLTTTLDAQITAAVYANAPADTYKEVVTLNITP